MIKDKNFNELTKLMEQIKLYTPKYLDDLGVAEGDPYSMVSCLSPDHDDSNPSCGYYKEGHVYHCFSCGEAFDIFKIATIFEDKPDTGKEFLIENVFYLAEKFGIAYEHLNIEFTEEDLIKLRKFKIMKILQDHVLFKMNTEYLKARNISEKTAKELGIGSANWKELEEKFIKENILEDEFQELGINKRNINSNKLIMMIQDELGRPVSFVSREMIFSPKAIADKINAINEKIEVLNLNFATKKEQKDFTLNELEFEDRAHLTTPKYINGKASIIYNKSRLFYGYSSVIDKISRSSIVYIVEGYIDFITAYEKGFYNVIALGSASFTEEHFDVLEGSKIKKVAIALDQDKTGKARTSTLMERIKNNNNTINKYYVASYKQEGKDLDEILNHGKFKTIADNGDEIELDIKSIENVFDTKTIFQYSIENLITKDLEDEEILEMILPTIMQEDSQIKKVSMSKELAKYTTSFSSDTIIRELNYRSDIERKGVVKKLENTFEKFKFEAIKDPKNAEVIITHMSDEIKEIQNEVYTSKKTIFETTKNLFQEFEENVGDSSKQIKTGYGVFDQARLTSPAVITICGRANSFKTTLFENICISIIQNNPNAMVFFYSTDDPFEKIMADLITNITGLPRDYVHDPLNHPDYGLNLHVDDIALDMYKIYCEGALQIEQWITDKRLVVQHANQLPTFNSYEAAMKEIAEDKDLKDMFKVSIIDSLNRISCPQEDRLKLEFLSDHVKKVAERNDFLVFQNVELKKVGDHHKVTIQDLKGTSKFEYDSNMIVVGNNNFHNLKGETDLVDRTNGDNPIITLEVEKTKMGGDKFDKFFLFLDGHHNKMTEIKKGTMAYENALGFWNDDLKKYQNIAMQQNAF